MATDIIDLGLPPDMATGIVDFEPPPDMATGTIDFAYAKGAFHNMIRFEVGPSKEQYYIHEKPAAECSEYVWSALHPAWRKESQDLVITLTDEDPIAFEIFLRWTYFRRIIMKYYLSFVPDSRDPLRKNDTNAYFMGTQIVESGSKWPRRLFWTGLNSHGKEVAIEDLVEAYLLGQYLNAPRFCDDVISIMLDIRTERRYLPSPSVIKRVFEHTPETSPLRRFMVESYAQHIRIFQRWDLCHISYHPDFDVATAAQLAGVTVVSARSLKCRYHLHVEDRCKSPHMDDNSAATFTAFVSNLKDIPNFGSSMVKVMVSPEAVPFLVHPQKIQLCNKCAEDADHEHVYPHVKPATFEKYLLRTYFHWAPAMLLSEMCDKNDDASLDNALKEMCDLFSLTLVLGTESTNPGLQNEIVDAVAEWVHIARRVPSVEIIDYAFGLFFTSNQLLGLLACIYAYAVTTTVSTNIRFLRQLATARSMFPSALRDCNPEDGVAYEGARRYVIFHRHLDGPLSGECARALQTAYRRRGELKAPVEVVNGLRRRLRKTLDKVWSAL